MPTMTIGDYDGDGRDDILWRSDTERHSTPTSAGRLPAKIRWDEEQKRLDSLASETCDSPCSETDT